MLEKVNENIVSDAFLRIIILGEGISIKSVTLPQVFLEILFFLSSSSSSNQKCNKESGNLHINSPPPIFQTKCNQNTESTEWDGCN